MFDVNPPPIPPAIFAMYVVPAALAALALKALTLPTIILAATREVAVKAPPTAAPMLISCSIVPRVKCGSVRADRELRLALTPAPIPMRLSGEWLAATIGIAPPRPPINPPHAPTAAMRSQLKDIHDGLRLPCERLEASCIENSLPDPNSAPRPMDINTRARAGLAARYARLNAYILAAVGPITRAVDTPIASAATLPPR